MKTIVFQKFAYLVVFINGLPFETLSLLKNIIVYKMSCVMTTTPTIKILRKVENCSYEIHFHFMAKIIIVADGNPELKSSLFYSNFYSSSSGDMVQMVGVKKLPAIYPRASANVYFRRTGMKFAEFQEI